MSFVELQESLKRRLGADTSEDEELRLRAARSLDEAQRSGMQLRSDQVDVRLLRPPWSSRRALAAAAGDQPLRCSVASCRADLVARRPQATALLRFLDVRAAAVEPYRRLGEARHLAWATAAVDAAVAAVQRARSASPSSAAAPRVLVAEGSLGAEAAAAAAAGARVTVCEPNRFAATAIREVARAHCVAIAP